jgi:hypothetical protein
MRGLPPFRELPTIGSNEAERNTIAPPPDRREQGATAP